MPKGLARWPQPFPRGHSQSDWGLGTACNTSADHFHLRCPALITLPLRKGKEPASGSVLLQQALHLQSLCTDSIWPCRRGCCRQLQGCVSPLEAASTYYTMTQALKYCEGYTSANLHAVGSAASPACACLQKGSGVDRAWQIPMQSKRISKEATSQQGMRMPHLFL